MKKHPIRALLIAPLAIAPLLLSMQTPALAEEKSAPPSCTIVARLDLIQVDPESDDSLPDSGEVKGNIEGLLANNRGFHLLQSSEVLQDVGRPVLLHLGRKYSLVYFDARSNQFQVQYVDTGVKLDIHTKDFSADSVRCEVTPEFSVCRTQKTHLSSPTTNYPETDVLREQLMLNQVRLGHSQVIASYAGQSPRNWLSAAGLKSNSGRLVIVLTLTKS